MLVVHTTVPLDPERREEALSLVEDLVEQSRREPGTLTYRAMTDVGDPTVLRFFEQYETAEAATVHQESEAYRQFVTVLPALADGDVETMQFEVAGDPETVTFAPEAAVPEDA